MKKLCKHFLVIAVVLCCIAGIAVNAQAAETVASGTCGENLTWTLDDEGTLAISGMGAMDDYATASNAPWYSCRTDIKAVVIQNGITSIGDRAFYNCTALTELSIGSDVQTIGTYAFRGCTALTEVTIPASVTEVKGSAFRACTLLTNIIFEGNAPTMGSYVFSNGADSITVYYYESSTGFNADTFSNVTFAPMHIGEWIVDTEATCTTEGSRHTDCTYCGITITETIPGSHYYADNICTLCGEGIVLYSGTCGSNAKWKLDATGKLTIFGTGSIYGYSNYSNYAPWYSYREQITQLIVENGITSIGSFAFWSCSSLQGVTIPDSVTSIGDFAFYGCNSLQSITVPDSVTSIYYSAFEDCSSLQSVIIPESVTNIEGCVFSGCNSLTGIWVSENNVYYSNDEKGVLYNKDQTILIQAPGAITGHYTIPDSVTSIGWHAFYNCSSLESVIIGSSVTSIGSFEFYGCSSLQSITIPDSIISIDNSAFEGCSSLESVTIPDSVTSIGNDAFIGCSSLTSITIPDSVTSIDSWVFGYCSSLQSITIPESVASIGDSTFSRCTSLQSITIPDSVTSIGDSAFSGCSSLTSVTIPNSVTSIGIYAFYNCSSLTSITIPESVASIGDSTFSRCTSLQSITIPDSVTSIGDSAFSGCSSLNHVAYTGTQSQWNAISIGYYNGNLTSATRHYETAFSRAEICTGYNIYCPVCDKVVGKEYVGNGTHSYETAVTAPTCTEGGYTTYSCSVCSESYIADEVNALGHSYETVVTAPDCTNGGYTTYTCSYCSEIYAAEYIEALGHSVQDGVCIVCKTVFIAVTTQPADQTVKDGTAAQFAVEATGNGLTYQWQYRSSSSANWANAKATGNTTATLSVPASVSRHGYQYRCKITDAAGNKVYTKTVTLYVLGIKTQPASKTVKVGATAKFTVAATGKGLTYQWQYRTSSTGSWKTAKATGNTTKTLSVSASVSRHGYQYRCRITDSAGNKVYTKTVTLNVLGIKTQPVSRTVKAGATAKFTVAATGKGLTYQWQYRTSSSGSWKNASATGNKTYTLSVAATVAKHGYQYRCKVTDSAGNTVYTSVVNLYVLGIKTQPASRTVKAGATAKFTVAATGRGLTFQWQYRTSSSGSWKNVSVASGKTANYSLTAAARHNGYQYRCKITDSAGNVIYTKTVKLTVK